MLDFFTAMKALNMVDFQLYTCRNPPENDPVDDALELDSVDLLSTRFARSLAMREGNMRRAQAVRAHAMTAPKNRQKTDPMVDGTKREAEEGGASKSTFGALLRAFLAERVREQEAEGKAE